jgi:hypothetical protein
MHTVGPAIRVGQSMPLQQPGQLLGIKGLAGVQHHGARLQMLDSQAQFAAG